MLLPDLSDEPCHIQYRRSMDNNQLGRGAPLARVARACTQRRRSRGKHTTHASSSISRNSTQPQQTTQSDTQTSNSFSWPTSRQSSISAESHQFPSNITYGPDFVAASVQPSPSPVDSRFSFSARDEVQSAELKSIRPSDGSENVKPRALIGSRPLKRYRATLDDTEKQLNSDVPVNSLKRKHRCLECKLDSGKRSCIGSPLCERCKTEDNSSFLTDGWTNEYFLDWHSWMQDLDNTLHAFTPSEVATPTSDTSLRDYPNPISLEFSFDDRVQVVKTHSHLVMFYPTEQTELYRVEVDGQELFRRPPALQIAQLDDVARAGVWGVKLWNADKARLAASDEVFWSTIQLFTGYFCMTHRLASTTIISSDKTAKNLEPRIATEIVYAFAWQLQRLYFEISRHCQKLMNSEECEMSPAVVLYSLEVLCSLMRKMQATKWTFGTQFASQHLIRLQADFNKRVEHILNRVLSIECYLSSKYKTGRQWQHIPHIVQFTRDLYETTDFPGHCIVTAFVAQDEAGLSTPPSSTDSKRKRRLVDVLSPSKNNVQDAAEPTLDYYITEDNARVTL